VTLPSFQHLVDAHWRDVARLAYALAGPGDADDVAQQAWTQALAAYPSVRSSANLRGWLLTITSRCATDVHRRRARRPIPVEDVGAVSALSWSGDPLLRHPVAVAQRADEAVWRLVAALPERQRYAVVLRYVADADHATIAQALGTSPAMSRRLVSDALSTLRKDLP